VAVFGVATGVLLSSAAPALAARPHVFAKSFGEPCVAGPLEPCEGKFDHPSGVAVNEETGQVYVLDQGDERIERFSSAGVYEAQFNGGDTPAGAFDFGAEPLTAGIAVDNSCHLQHLSGSACAAADPSNGDVYVTDSEHRVLDKFYPDGVYTGDQLTESGPGSHSGASFHPLRGVTVDPNGGVWVYQETGEIDSFSDALANAFQTRRYSPFGETKPGFAVDSEDNLYVHRGEPFVGKLTSSGTQLIESVEEPEDKANEATAVAVELSSDDGTSDDVYIDNGTSVGKFSTATYNERLEEYEGTLIERFGAGHLTSGSGIAVNSASEDVYVADTATDAVDIFGLAPVPPTIDDTSTGTVTAESAELRASIDSNASDTSYHFEYGTSTSYGTSIPVPEADIGSGEGDVTVSQEVTRLHPNTPYHFRVVAQNTAGTTTGHDDTFVYPTAGSSESCPNEELRTGASANLPDCRAYEMVTPVQKAGSIVKGISDTVAADGSSLAGASTGVFAGLSNAEIPPLGSVHYRFTRTPSGWTTAPLQVPRGDAKSIGVEDSLWSPANLGSEVDHLSLREADGRVSDIGPVWPLALGPDPTESGISYIVQGAAAEASHGVVFTIGQETLLWPYDETVKEAGNSTPSLYEYVGACGGEAECEKREPMLVGVSGGPGSTALIGQCGTELGAASHVFRGSKYNAISESGQSVFFTAEADSRHLSPASTRAWASSSTCAAGGKTGIAPPTDELYARLGASQTVWVSEPQCTPDSACHNVSTEPYTTEAASKAAGVVFEGASADGSKAFFTTTQQLTNSDTDSTRDLYEYDFDAPAGQRLTQVSAGGSGDATPGAGAEVEGVSRISEDGSHVYFVAKGALTTSTSPGAQDYGSHGEPLETGAVAQSGAENLYVYDTETKQTAFIADLCSGPEASGGLVDAYCPRNLNDGGNHNDQALWDHGAEGGDERPVQSTPDGRHLVFTSYGDLTADDTSTARQVFEYDAQSEGLVRVSIGEDGFDNNGNTNTVRESRAASDTANASIVTLPYTEIGVPRGGAIARTMSDDGSYVFFMSPVGLTPQALNDTPTDSEGDLAQNVYEYHDGRVSLVSDGKDTSLIKEQDTRSGVSLIGTDASGADVFFTTVDPLVAQDTDTQLDIYDARVGGGFPAPAASSECQGETCQGVLGAPPSLGAPSSATFSGAGNLAPPPSAPPKAKAKALTRAQKLAKAWHACQKKKNRKKRAVCEKQATRAYGAAKKASNDRKASR
jgi:uncharacterized membrane protein